MCCWSKCDSWSRGCGGGSGRCCYRRGSASGKECSLRRSCRGRVEREEAPRLVEVGEGQAVGRGGVVAGGVEKASQNGAGGERHQAAH
jgi:hypothetical protein